MVETQEKAKQTLIALGLPPFLDETGQEAFLRCAKEGVLTAVQAYVAIGMPLEIHEKYSKETPLIRAVEGKHSAVITFLLEAGADLKGRDNPGDTALLTAVNWQHPKIVTMLLEAGADPHAVSNGGWTPLSSAVDKENRAIIRILLEAGVNVNQEANGLAALDFAPTTNDLTITQMLIKAGANVNKPTNSNGRTYLMKAAKEGNYKLLDLYLKAGAAINATSRSGWTAWMIATEKGFTKLAEHLRKQGASTNGLDRISFLQAASKGQLEEVQRALDEGIAIDTLSMKGDTALHLTSAENHPAVVSLLLKAGADIEAKNIAQATPLSRAAAAGHLEVVKILLGAGANPDTDTPLVTASWNEKREIVQALLMGGANVNVATAEHNNTALLWASFQGTSETALLLIAAGANLNIQDKDGVTALSCAAFRGHVELVELLVQAGADVNIANEELETPLHRAINQKSPQMVELLLAGGADPMLRSTRGRTSVDEAYLWGEQCLDPLRAFLTWRTYHQLVNEQPSLLKEEPEQFYQQLARTQNNVSLLEWIHANELEIVRGLLQAGMSPNTHNGDRTTALMVAVESDSLPMVKLLLEFSADVNARSWWEGFALLSAAGKGNREIVAALLEAGANVHLQNEYYTALHSAAETGHIAIMEQLHQAGAEIDPNPFGWSPLMRASLRGLPSAVEWLLTRGANVNVRDYWFGNALTIAAEQKSGEVVSLLLTKEIELDVPTNLHGQEGYTPLMYAVQAGLMTMVAQLRRKGANPHLRNGKGQTVFDLASYRPAIADLLRSQNTEQAEIPTHEIPSPKPRTPHPPLHRAVLTNNVDRVQRLLEAGSNIDAPNERGDTALHFSAACGQDEIVQILLTAGANVNAENRVGETPWVLAATNRHKAVEQLLDRSGATINTNKLAEHMGRRMKINDAVKLGDIAQVKELIESNEVDIDALTMGDVTALITAAIQNDRAMTRALLALGANVNAANSEGKTPLFFARYSSFEEIASILVEAGATWPARYIVTCPGCGKQSELFFLPQENGFAYCRECYQ